MAILFGAIMGWIGAWSGGHSGDFVCTHQEWTAVHMQEQLGWNLEKGREVARAQCRSGR